MSKNKWTSEDPTSVFNTSVSVLHSDVSLTVFLPHWGDSGPLGYLRNVGGSREPTGCALAAAGSHLAGDVFPPASFSFLGGGWGTPEC